MQLFLKIDFFTVTFQRFCLDFNSNFYLGQLSMAVYDKFPARVVKVQNKSLSCPKDS